jgi:hypothetical protein
MQKIGIKIDLISMLGLSGIAQQALTPFFMHR